MGSFDFDFGTIVAATNNFSEANKLGDNVFGYTYKGVLANGQYIAVKRMDKYSSNGEIEFKNEVITIARLRHRNLVRLVGCCLKGEERLLIYEFMPNGNLEDYLFGERRQLLDWPTRYKIIEGIVRGMVYLHEDSRFRIIHRDLKPRNILLDDEMNPKITDFGLARLFQTDQTEEEIDRIVGTFGYLAPEYSEHGILSIKSDVYSLGVLLLNIISGKKSYDVSRDETALITVVWRHWNNGTAIEVIDSTLGAVSIPQILRCLHIGLLCTQVNAADRPTTSSILLMLNSPSLSLPTPSQPYTDVRRYSGDISSGSSSSEEAISPR